MVQRRWKNRRPVCYLKSDGTPVCFESIRLAERMTGCDSTNISRCARGQFKQTAGLTWVYMDELP